MSKKLILYNPHTTNNKSKMTSMGRMSPLGLATVAGKFPGEYEIEIIDLKTKNERNYKDADLVGITSTTAVAPRAYEICKIYKERGIPVFMGGPHPTTCPEEALKYCDTVIKGRSEAILDDFIRDFENGEMKKVYKRHPIDFKETDRVRHDLLDYSKYLLGLIETSMGCPNDCFFCCANILEGKKIIYKNPERIREELHGMEMNRILLSDNNIYPRNKKARQHIIDVADVINEFGNIKWSAQGTFEICEDDKVLSKISDSGCGVLFVGIETSSPNHSVGRKNNTRDAKKRVKKLHDYGIGVAGSFIFGFEWDDKSVFRNTTDFVSDIELDSNRFQVLTPFPGTRLYKNLDKESRIFAKNYPEDWQLYNMRDVVYYPNQMTPEDLKRGIEDAVSEANSTRGNISKAFRTMINTRNIHATGGCFILNRNIRKVTL